MTVPKFAFASPAQTTKTVRCEITAGNVRDTSHPASTPYVGTEGGHVA